MALSVCLPTTVEKLKEFVATTFVAQKKAQHRLKTRKEQRANARYVRHLINMCERDGFVTGADRLEWMDRHEEDEKDQAAVAMFEDISLFFYGADLTAPGSTYAIPLSAFRGRIPKFVYLPAGGAAALFSDARPSETNLLGVARVQSWNVYVTLTIYNTDEPCSCSDDDVSDGDGRSPQYKLKIQNVFYYTPQCTNPIFISQPYILATINQDQREAGCYWFENKISAPFFDERGDAPKTTQVVQLSNKIATMMVLDPSGLDSIDDRVLLSWLLKHEVEDREPICMPTSGYLDEDGHEPIVAVCADERWAESGFDDMIEMQKHNNKYLKEGSITWVEIPAKLFAFADNFERGDWHVAKGPAWEDLVEEDEYFEDGNCLWKNHYSLKFSPADYEKHHYRKNVLVFKRWINKSTNP